MSRKWLTCAVLLNFYPIYVFPQGVHNASTSASTRQVLSFVPCDAEWFHFGEKCYRHYSKYDGGKPWSVAADFCNVEDGHLVSIHSKDELDFLVSFLLLDVKTTVWIGLSNRLNKLTYTWQDGSPLNYENWSPSEPNAAEEECVAMFFSVFGHEEDKIGRWSNITCTHKRPFICEKKTDPEKDTPNLQLCSSDEGGGWKFRTSCYHVITEQQTWDEAEDHCNKNFSGHLVTVLDKTTDIFLNFILSTLNKEVWLGIKIKDQFQQKWTSGWHVSYDAGLSNRFRDFKEGLCVLRKNRKEWTMVPCSEAHSFVCEVSRATPPVLKPPVNGSHCPTNLPDWRDLDGEFCYFMETEKRVSWNQAEAECESRGGNLVSIHSAEETAILHPFLKYTQEDLYIGLLKRTENRKKFRWVDGTKVDYLNFYPGQPDERSGEETCVEIWKVWKESTEWDFMKWNDVDCGVPKGFICSVKKKDPLCIEKCGQSLGVECPRDGLNADVLECKCRAEDQSYDEGSKECKVVLPDVKRSDGVVPCDPGWYYFQEKCYKIFGRNPGKPWGEAGQHCKEVGGHLVSIHSKQELDFLVSFLLLDIKHRVWIGLSNPGDKSKFTWQDGSRLDYTNWMLTNPDGEEEENCVGMVFSVFGRDEHKTGQWDDVVCTHWYPYICQRKSDPKIETPDPQFCSLDEGGGWKYQSSCYHLVTELMTWEEAEDHCNKTFNGHLVTVLDMTVDFFLNHIVSRVNGAIWIGIKSRNQFQQQWSSGWHVSYDADLTKRLEVSAEGFCVVRSQRKIWTLARCSVRHPFICETSKVTSPVLKPTVKGSHCPTNVHDWRDLGGDYCYFIETENRLSWFKAEDACTRRGGHLVSIHSKEENEILHPFVKYTQDDIHIGLIRSSENRKIFKWDDGTAFDYSAWGSGQPDDYGSSESCAELWRVWMPTLVWWDASCVNRKGYICSVRKIPPGGETDSSSSPSGSQLALGAQIGIGVFVIVVLLVFGIGTIFLVRWRRKHHTTNFFSKWRSTQRELTVEDDYHVYEPIQYFQQQAAELRKSATDSSAGDSSQHKDAHPYESVIYKDAHPYESVI